MKNIPIYSIHFSKTSRKCKKNLPDASLKFITCMHWLEQGCLPVIWYVSAKSIVSVTASPAMARPLFQVSMIKAI